MEQTTQQISQGSSLPIKTKIAAWLLIIQGVSPFLCSFCGKICPLCVNKGLGPFLHYHPILQSFFETIEGLICSISGGSGWGFIVAIIPGIFLFRRKNWAWSFSVALIPLYIVVISGFFIVAGLLSGYSVFNLLLIILLLILLPLIAFILLILDRKNFWKIAT